MFEVVLGLFNPHTVLGCWMLTFLVIGLVILAGFVLRFTMPIQSTPLSDQTSTSPQPAAAPRQPELAEMEA